MLLQLLVGVLVVTLGWALQLRYGRAGRLFQLIPGPAPLPILGNALHVITSPGDLFKYLRSLQQYGGLVKLVAFDFRTVNIYNAQDAEKLLSSTKYNEKRAPYNFFTAWLGEGLLISNGDKWQHRRKLLTPAFHFNILKQFSSTFNELMCDFINKINLETTKDMTELAPIVADTTLQIMCETAMGTSMGEGIKFVTQKYLEGIQKLGHIIFTRTTRILTHKDWIFKLTTTNQQQKTALTHLHKFTNQIINERKKYVTENALLINEDSYGSKTKLAMLDLLIQNEKDGKIDHEGIREEVDTFMFEGHDTTATALSFMIMRIANEPEVQKKIYEELQNIFGESDRMPTTEDLADMKYLELCIKESLRIYPSVPFIARYLTEDTFLSGFKIPAGTVCHIHIFDINRQETVYPEPERFIPERFLPENQIKRSPYSFLSFSAGPRNCIGQKFAMLEMKTVMSTLLRKFKLEPVTKPEEIEYAVDIILRPIKPLYVKFRNRS